MARSSNRCTSDQALVLLIVKEFRESVNGYLGRTAVQKLCYFAQALGVPLTYPFRIYHYGPYSDSLSFDIDMLLASEALEDASRNPGRYSDFRLGAEAKPALEGHEALINRYQQAIRRVAEAFGRFAPQTLELLSTLHFIDRKLKASGIAHPDKTTVMADFRQVKEDRFSEDEVERAYEAMKRAGLIG